MKRGITNDLIRRVVSAYPDGVEVQSGGYYRYFPQAGIVTATTGDGRNTPIVVKTVAVEVPKWARRSGWLIIVPGADYNVEHSALIPMNEKNRR